MTSQPLPGLEPEPVLTERQEQALAIVREQGPLTSEELGARLRELRGGRGSGAPWDVSNGRAIAESLAAKGLVRRVRGRGWVAASWQEPQPEDAYDPQTAEIPF